MGEAEQVSALIGDVYDASLDPALWPVVLENSANFVGGVASALFMKDAVKKAHNTVYTWGYDPDFNQIYLEKFVPFDPFTSGQFFFALEEPLSVADLMSHEEHRKSRFYKERVQPQGWIDAIAATLEKSATAYSAFSVIRHERNGIVDDELRRAVSIGKTVDLRTVEAEALRPCGRMCPSYSGVDSFRSSLRLEHGSEKSRKGARRTQTYTNRRRTHPGVKRRSYTQNASGSRW